MAGKFTGWFFEEGGAAGAVKMWLNGAFGVGDAADAANARSFSMRARASARKSSSNPNELGLA